MNQNKIRKKVILVSGASGIVGYGIIKSLRASNLNIFIIGTSVYDDSIASFVCDIFEKAPLTSDINYIGWLCTIIKKYNVDMIIPGIELDVSVWNTNRKVLSSTGCYVLLNNEELISLCTDKWLFYSKLLLENSDLAIESRLDSNFDALARDFGIPFLLKPRRGFASKGIVKVENKDIFNEHSKNIGSLLMAQPIIGTDETEYTISGFFDEQSLLCGYMCLKRKLSKDGFTNKASVDHLEQAESAITILAQIFKPIGPTNFQFRLHNGDLKLLEINPRLSSSTSIRTAFGYNESEMSIKYFLDKEVIVQPKIRYGHAVRYIEDYISYDSDNI